MSADKNDAAGEIRLHGEDEAGKGSGVRDLAGLAIAVALFGLAVLIARDAASYPIRRSYAQFGPEIVPYIVAAGIAVLALATVVSALRGSFERRDALNVGGLLWLILAIVLQIVMLFLGTGFVPAAAVLFACAARAFGQTTMVLNLAIGAVMATVLYILFRYGLGLALPAGPVENVIASLLR